jgi:hypothetical protein
MLLHLQVKYYIEIKFQRYILQHNIFIFKIVFNLQYLLLWNWEFHRY